MASAIAAARQRINDVGADGDLDGAAAHGEIDLDIESIADSIELPEGKVIDPPSCMASRSTASPARCWTYTAEPVAVPAAGRPAAYGH
jgi:hypothetical protein